MGLTDNLQHTKKMELDCYLPIVLLELAKSYQESRRL